MEVSGDSWRLDPTTHGIPPGPICTFAIEPSHPLVQEWPPLRDEIEAALDRSQVDWYALEVYRRRRTIKPVDGEDDTTILITGRRDEDTHWRRLSQTVRDICELHGKGSLRIELMNGAIDRYAPPSEPSYETVPQIGSSIGAAGVNWASGTLGGFVTLSSAGEKELVCALTCHHVLCTTPEPVMAADPTLRVEQPSAKSYEEKRGALDGVIAHMQGQIARQAAQIAAGGTTERQAQGLEDMRKRETNVRKTQAAVASFDRSFGYIFATSGYRTAPRGCALDWGLVRVDDRRRGFNEMFGPRSFPVRLVLGLMILEMSDLNVGDQVAHFGLRSGPNLGVFSAIKSLCKLPGQQGTTTEYSICGLEGSPFAKRGDSGAFVVNMEGALVAFSLAGP